MKRIIDKYLLDWKDSAYRKPILLRGARQVGKTYAVRQLGKHFDNFVEINFEVDEGVNTLFDKGLDPTRIIKDINSITHKKIIPGKTLLFFDEIQSVPKAVIALRYFYERLPELHIIAAGSLIDFAIQSVGIPVGRVDSLYMYPLSFLEFLCACGNSMLVDEILTSSILRPSSELVHDILLSRLGEYVAIGGMPEAVVLWTKKEDPSFCEKVYGSLIATYRQDFGRYSKTLQLKYVEALFNSSPHQLGAKFKYSYVNGNYRKRELAPCLDLLVTAGVVHQVFRSAGNGIPPGAEISFDDFKIIFLDVALSQAMLGLNLKSWFLNPKQAFVNKGALIESLIGQEMLAYSNPAFKRDLFYWRRNARGSEAEVDYIAQLGEAIIPIEVKSGKGSTLKSMHQFLNSHPQSPYGIRFSVHNYSVHDKIHSIPLYAVVKFIIESQRLDRKNFEFLCR